MIDRGRGPAWLAPLLALYLTVPFAARGLSIGSDEGLYLLYARRLVEGGFAGAGGPDMEYLWYGPGLPLALAPLVSLGVPVELVRLCGPLFLFGAVVAFHALLRLYAEERWALVGAYAFGLYPPLVTVVTRVWSEPLALLCVTAGMLFLARGLRSGRRTELALAGLAFGWLSLTRVAFVPILAAMAAVLGARSLAGLRRKSPGAGGGRLVRTGLRGPVPAPEHLKATRAAAAGRRRTAAVFALALVCCLPWFAYTWAVTDRPLYLTNSGGLNLYWMASPEPDELGDWYGYHYSVPAIHRRFFDSLRGLDPVERDLRVRERALELIRAKPWGYLGNLAPNVSRLLFGAPYSDRRTGLKPLLFALPAVLLLLAVLASVAGPLRRRRRLPPEGAVFALLAGLTLTLHSALSAEPRMLLPVVPVGVWLVAWACSPRGTGARS